MLDAGVPNKFMPEHIFITHGHLDHIYQLPLCFVNQANRRFKTEMKTQVYVPDEITEYVQTFISSAYVMSKFNPNHDVCTKYDLHGVKDGTFLYLKIKGKNFKIEIINCIHSVPCVGYGFSEVRSKLKDEYTGLSNKEILELKNNGIEITGEKEYPYFCYLGDTSIKVFENFDYKKYGTIFLECNFLTDDHLEMSERKKHICLSQLEPYIINNPQITFVLYHFSQRYKFHEVREFFKNKPYKNIHLWIPK